MEYVQAQATLVGEGAGLRHNYTPHMAKYSPLIDHLASSTLTRLSLSFAELDEILGSPIPASAKRYAAFWASGNHVGRQIATVGWRASLSPDPPNPRPDSAAGTRKQVPL